jgi:hypothetical protein
MFNILKPKVLHLSHKAVEHFSHLRLSTALLHTFCHYPYSHFSLRMFWNLFHCYLEQSSLQNLSIHNWIAENVHGSHGLTQIVQDSQSGLNTRGAAMAQPIRWRLEVILGFSKIRAREECSTFELFSMFYSERFMIIHLAYACALNQYPRFITNKTVKRCWGVATLETEPMENHSAC